MEMFSSCAGKCNDCVIHFTGGCIAGHGDDDYSKITISQARELLSRGVLSGRKINEITKIFPELKSKISNSISEKQIISILDNTITAHGFLNNYIIDGKENAAKKIIQLIKEKHV